MIRLKKKGLILFISTLVVAVVGIGGYFVSKNAMKAWDDASTWKVDSTIALPVQGEGNYKVEVNELGSGRTSIKVPFCVLFDAKLVSQGNIEYYCAAIPYSSVELTRYFPEHYKLNKDIVLSFNESKDALPTDFLGSITISTDTISSVGTNPVPASIETVVLYKKPKMSITAIINHYQKVLAGEQETYADTVLESWSVTRVRTATEYSATEKKEIIKEWRAKAWKDINKIFNTQSFLTSTDNKDFVSKIGPAMAWRSIFCPAVTLKDECELSYIQNSSTNIMYYSYAASVIDNKIAIRVAEVLRDRVIPFVYQHNPKMGEYYDNCNNETECAYFHHMQVYDYPVCPVNEIGNAKQSEFIKNLFIDLRYVLMGEDYVDRPLDYEKTVAEIDRLKKDFLRSGLDREFEGRDVGEGVSFIDRTCLHLIYGSVEPDKRIVEKLRDLYMVFVLGRTYIDEKNYANSDLSYEDSLFQMVLDASSLNAYKYSLVPQPYASYQRVLTGVYKQDTGYLTDEYWASLNSTLILLYLTGSN